MSMLSNVMGFFGVPPNNGISDVSEPWRNQRAQSHNQLNTAHPSVAALQSSMATHPELYDFSLQHANNQAQLSAATGPTLFGSGSGYSSLGQVQTSGITTITPMMPNVLIPTINVPMMGTFVTGVTQPWIGGAPSATQ